MEFSEIVKKRYATKKFNGEQIPEEQVEELLEMIRMSASSYGLQPYKIKIITDQETKDKLLPHSYNQQQVTTCSHLLVFCANTKVKEHIDQYLEFMREKNTAEEKIEAYKGILYGFESRFSTEQKLIWAQKQIYIAIANALNGAKALGFDSCPMEGFIPAEYSKVLDLPEHLVPTVLVPIGYAADEAREKIRYPKEELFF